MRLEIRRGEQLKQGQELIGNKVNIKVVKNKVAPPFKSATLDLIYGKGISRSGDILDLASDADIIKKSGAWYSYNDQKIGQGRDNAKKFLEENREIYEEVTNKVKDHYK